MKQIGLKGNRQLLAGVVTAAAALAVTQTVSAQEFQQLQQRLQQQQQQLQQQQQQPQQKTTHTGTLLNADQQQLTMRSEQRGQHRHRITDQTQVIVNGRQGSLQQLEQGDQLRVTVGPNDEVLRIEVRREGRFGQPQQRFGQPQRRQPQRGFRPEQPASRQLGVQLGPSPTQGVFVQSVQRGSPADEAGIEEGDYILSVDGQQISSEQDLQDALQQVQAGESIQAEIWRDRQRQQVRLSLPEQREMAFRRPQRGGPFEGQQEPDRPFLGVMLQPAERQEGVEITQVHPQGPASQAGLQSGDVIVEIEGTQVSSPQEAARAIESLQPGDRAELVVIRNGREQPLDVRLASSMQFRQPFQEQRGRRAFREPAGPSFDTRDADIDRQAAQQRQRIEQLLRDLQRDVQRLQQQVQQLEQRQPGQRQFQPQGTQPQQWQDRRQRPGRPQGEQQL